MIDKISQLIDIKLDNINTVALGIITSVDLTKLRCNVKLKHKIQGQEIELFDVPIAFPKFNDCSVIIAPKEGDVVLVVFSKYELEEQLKNREPVDVNELLKFNINNAIAIAGIYTLVDSVPAVNQDEILIQHKSGHEIKLNLDEIIIKHSSGTQVKIDNIGNAKLENSNGDYIQLEENKITLKAQTVYIDGDLQFKTIMGTDADSGEWHKREE